MSAVLNTDSNTCCLYLEPCFLSPGSTDLLIDSWESKIIGERSWTCVSQYISCTEKTISTFFLKRELRGRLWSVYGKLWHAAYVWTSVLTCSTCVDLNIIILSRKSRKEGLHVIGICFCDRHGYIQSIGTKRLAVGGRGRAFTLWGRLINITEFHLG